VLRLREQLLVHGGSGSPIGERRPTLRPEVTQKLLKAEETLRNYAKQWETKQQSMKMVKSKLLKKKFAIFGTENLDDNELQRTPYLISLSCDPLLNLAVKVYLPTGNILRIGKTIDGLLTTNEGGASSIVSSLAAPDLQIDGLGIEIGHCELFHQENGTVLLTSSSSSSAITYVNGRQLMIDNMGCEGVQLCGGDRIVLGVCSHVFAFIDPRLHHNPTTTPTYEQALREVILGRGETDTEKKERLASLVWLIAFIESLLTTLSLLLPFYRFGIFGKLLVIVESSKSALWMP
jgi:hypothetical protein